MADYSTKAKRLTIKPKEKYTCMCKQSIPQKQQKKTVQEL